MNICFGVAKWRKYKGRRVRWPLLRPARWPCDWIVAIRLAEGNTSILDYVLLPSTSFSYRILWISEHNLKKHKVTVFHTFEELARSLVKRVNKAVLGTSKLLDRDHASLEDGRHSRAKR